MINWPFAHGSSELQRPPETSKGSRGSRVPRRARHSATIASQQPQQTCISTPAALPSLAHHPAPAQGPKLPNYYYMVLQSAVCIRPASPIRSRRAPCSGLHRPPPKTTPLRLYASTPLRPELLLAAVRYPCSAAHPAPSSSCQPLISRLSPPENGPLVVPRDALRKPPRHDALVEDLVLQLASLVLSRSSSLCLAPLRFLFAACCAVAPHQSLLRLGWLASAR